MLSVVSDVVPPIKRSVKVWSDVGSEALGDCFETTIWEALCTPRGDDIDNLKDCISDYMNNMNNKPWVTP